MTTTAPASATFLSMLKLRTAEVHEKYQTYDPPHMAAFGAELRDIGPALQCLAMAINHLSIKSHTAYPVHGALVQMLVETYMHVVVSGKQAEEVPAVFQAVHEHDIMRLDEPRKGYNGEQMWNIRLGQQTDGGGIRNRPSVLLSVSAYIAQTYSTNYAPEHMMQVYREYCDLNESIQNVAACVRLIHDRTNDVEPVEPPVTDAIAKVLNGLEGAASQAANLMPAFRRYHAADLRKHEAPRKGYNGEARWDV
ncbi:hypothetical protein [Streptomyces albidoflavus]|uniref:hypothetical protein n=1 Tax=Streptomyces albidoflavus TaxID=1886 RepID=UPI00101F5DC9|nr:hypothetical protein [Streptomyces albidoflavus]RZF02941.1 hypothetical protein C0R05_32545 [Streptomyces albidoflavus]